eukprot:CAMPEP_0183385740 /NCGR_PEP_ID=MMETSP0370-20130417/1757_1 /TAXON_ID=268820 /ORGANISM="Peridinium aciculiferum, Strain PAER-2" /LENGTH=83 /DNA_ID=CAMNT_0025563855 /DNA_START=15 /DNA_END=262 /DNA_ORIENTATION=+
MARFTALTFAVLATGACLALHAVTFVAPRSGAETGLRGTRTALEAEKQDMVLSYRASKSEKLKAATGFFEYSTGATNDLSIVT